MVGESSSRGRQTGETGTRRRRSRGCLLLKVPRSCPPPLPASQSLDPRSPSSYPLPVPGLLSTPCASITDTDPSSNSHSYPPPPLAHRLPARRPLPIPHQNFSSSASAPPPPFPPRLSSPGIRLLPDEGVGRDASPDVGRPGQLE